MRLQTWKTVYSFKINPVPSREFWEKSQVPSRLIPPYIPPQVGRAGKKRKKSAGEVTKMVKDGKLIRKGGTVTCCKYGQKGNNKRSCKGTSVAGSGSVMLPQPFTRVRELWNICGKVGTLADVYIAKRKNKLGQMFGFCRYIKVSNSEDLINSLSNIWIGKLRLHANVARFDRKVEVKNISLRAKTNPPIVKDDSNFPHLSKDSKYVDIAKASLNSGGKATNIVKEDNGFMNESITLSQEKSNDFSLDILGCFKDFRSIANTRNLCRSEGFLDVDFKYLGGLWVLFEFTSQEAKKKFINHKVVSRWFSSMKPWHDDFVVEERLIWLEIEGVPIRAWHNDTFERICSKWGEVLFTDDSDDCNRLSKRLCIKSSHALLVFASILVTLNNVTYAIRVRELCSWTPTFVGGDVDSEEEGSMGNYEDLGDKNFMGTNVESVADALEGENGQPYVVDEHDDGYVAKTQEPVINEILEEVGMNEQSKEKDSDPFGLDSLINKKSAKVTKLSTLEMPIFPPGFTPNNTGTFHNSESQNGSSLKQPGFSMLERLTETIKVGLALGLNMKGCEDTLASLVDDKGDSYETKMLHVDLWMLRRIWGNTHFDFASTSARGLSGGILCMWNSLVFSKTKILCNENYLVVDGLWLPDDEGPLVTMGDFNEVREAGERLGSVFNKRQAEVFNDFILDSYLIDIPLGGYNYTWTDKCHIGERYDHRPILLKESEVDYGPTPFWFFHSWLDMGGFHKLVVDTWSNDGIDDANAKTAKLKWALEGDENTSFFHGMLKKKRRQLAIKGILKNGEWIEEPDLVKTEFFDHFRTRFKLAAGISPTLDAFSFNSLSPCQRDKLELQISREEIKRAVWDYGGDGAPGPDGFTFKFFTAFWDLLEDDVVRFVQEFFCSHTIPKGCNSSFIALIPKVSNAKFVSYFRPISLIGCQYKIISKILANRLSVVIGSCISLVQTAFIKGRNILDGPLILNEAIAWLSVVIGSCISLVQTAFIKGRNILDGPLILNEAIAWYQQRKKELMVCKVDFEKAFDSLRWDFLDSIMGKIGFGVKWRSWIQ
ncbi:RNA-directed DNA polymerase, eukaryota, partial [Tanacetum coccineum]